VTVEHAAATPIWCSFWVKGAVIPGALLSNRMGDFYEMFFDDAVAASQALDNRADKARSATNGKRTFRMCGVPYIPPKAIC